MTYLVLISGCQSGSNTTNGNEDNLDGGSVKYIVDAGDAVIYADIHLKNGDRFISEPFGSSALQGIDLEAEMHSSDLREFYNKYYKPLENSQGSQSIKRFGFIRSNYGVIPNYGTPSLSCYKSKLITSGQADVRTSARETYGSREATEKFSTTTGVAVATENFKVNNEMSYGSKFNQNAITATATLFQWYIMPLTITYDSNASSTPI